MDINQLKKDYPNTWANFIEYLRENFEFWEKEKTSEKTLWFCERSFLTQLGYFLGWLETGKINDIRQRDWDPEGKTDGDITMIEYMKIALPLIFKYHEEKVFV